MNFITKFFNKKPKEPSLYQIKILKAIKNNISLSEQATSLEEYELYREALICNFNNIWESMGLSSRITTESFDVVFEKDIDYRNMYRNVNKLKGKV